MHTLRMATKTISLAVEAYERLRSARRSPSESFTQVILRAQWPAQPMTAGEYLVYRRATGTTLAQEDLAILEEAQRNDLPPENKWARG